MQNVNELEGFDEMVAKFASGLTLKQRFAGLSPQQRLADLAPAQQVLALSDEVLRGLPDEYLRSLPADVQDALRARIGRPAA